MGQSIGIEAAALTEEGDVGPLGPTRLLLSKPVIAAVSGSFACPQRRCCCHCHCCELPDTQDLIQSLP